MALFLTFPHEKTIFQRSKVVSWPYFTLIWGILYGEVVLDWIGLDWLLYTGVSTALMNVHRPKLSIQATEVPEPGERKWLLFTYTVKQLTRSRAGTSRLQQSWSPLPFEVRQVYQPGHLAPVRPAAKTLPSPTSVNLGRITHPIHMLPQQTGGTIQVVSILIWQGFI